MAAAGSEFRRRTRSLYRGRRVGEWCDGRTRVCIRCGGVRFFFPIGDRRRQQTNDGSPANQISRYRSPTLSRTPVAARGTLPLADDVCRGDCINARARGLGADNMDFMLSVVCVLFTKNTTGILG